jgi:hypothetical protein
MEVIMFREIREICEDKNERALPPILPKFQAPVVEEQITFAPVNDKDFTPRPNFGKAPEVDEPITFDSAW